MPIVIVRKQSQHLGARFWQTPEGEVLLVHKNDHGIFGFSIKVGMAIRRINGTGCHSTAKAIHLLEKAPLGHDLEIEASLPTCVAERNSRRSCRPTMKSIDSDDLTCTDVSDSEESIVDGYGDDEYQYQYNVVKIKVAEDESTGPNCISNTVATSSPFLFDHDYVSDDLSCDGRIFHDNDFEDDDDEATVSTCDSSERLDAQDSIFFLI